MSSIANVDKSLISILSVSASSPQLLSSSSLQFQYQVSSSSTSTSDAMSWYATVSSYISLSISSGVFVKALQTNAKASNVKVFINATSAAPLFSSPVVTNSEVGSSPSQNPSSSSSPSIILTVAIVVGCLVGILCLLPASYYAIYGKASHPVSQIPSDPSNAYVSAEIFMADSIEVHPSAPYLYTNTIDSIPTIPVAVPIHISCSQLNSGHAFEPSANGTPIIHQQPLAAIHVHNIAL